MSTDVRTDVSPESNSLPPRLRYIGEYNGGPIVHSPANEDPVQQLKDIRNLQIRDDDVIVAAYRKCGTHWVWEMTNMLLQQSATIDKHAKEFFMIDYIKVKNVEQQESPRILNSHLYLSQLPEQAFSKKIKIVHVTRNPKDTLVSFFYHYKQIASDDFTLGNLVDAIVAGKKLACGDQFAYLRHVEEFEKANPDFPIKTLVYEDIKQDPVSAVKSLANFLNVPASDQLCLEIAEACDFNNMKASDNGRILPEEFQRLGRKLQLYRKGQVGDWKNHLTVRDNEVLDAFIEREMAKGLNFQFRYV